MIRNYAQALEYLNGRSSRRLPGRSTTLQFCGPDDDTIGVRYHRTFVVQYRKDRTILLTSGGYYTMTTRSRIETYAPARITSDRGQWRLVVGEDWLDSIWFTDGTIVDEHGVLLSGLIPRQMVDRIQQLERMCKGIDVDEWKCHPHAIEFRRLMREWWTLPNAEAYDALNGVPAMQNRTLTARGVQQPGFHFSPAELRVEKIRRDVATRLLGTKAA